MTFEDIERAAAHIRSRLAGREPTVGLVLGSGLGAFAERLVDAVAIDYHDIPNFPHSTVVGHAGRLVVGRAPGTNLMCAAMQGRVHFYEGHSMKMVTFPIRVLMALGIKTFVVTNAAGGVNPKFSPGQLVLLSDHINMLPEGPLRGDNDERLGPRFPDMTTCYPVELRELAKRAGKSMGLELAEGVYVALPGPTYETPAEVRMLRVLGADMTGMSTVPEVVVARHGGARCLGISCITNMAAGMTGEALSHDEVTETATRVRATFVGLLEKILAELAAEGGGSGMGTGATR